MKDDEGKWVLTKIKYSIFTWDFGKYKNTIAHSEKCCPELDIHTGFSKFARFYKRVEYISKDYTFYFSFASIFTKKDPSTDKPIYFTPYAEYEVIRKEVS